MVDGCVTWLLMGKAVSEAISMITLPLDICEMTIASYPHLHSYD